MAEFDSKNPYPKDAPFIKVASSPNRWKSNGGEQVLVDYPKKKL